VPPLGTGLLIARGLGGREGERERAIHDEAQPANAPLPEVRFRPLAGCFLLLSDRVHDGFHFDTGWRDVQELFSEAQLKSEEAKVGPVAIDLDVPAPLVLEVLVVVARIAPREQRVAGMKENEIHE